MTEPQYIGSPQEEIVVVFNKVRTVTARLLRESFPTFTRMAVGVIAYTLLVPPSLFVGAIIWGVVAVDRMFVCTDGPGLNSLAPPFIHDCCGDHYVWPAIVVWLLWGLLVAAALILPAAMVTLFAYVGRPSKATE